MVVYIITTETFPNGLAATQRVKCYAKCIADTGAKCQVICLNRCEDRTQPLGNKNTHGLLDGYSFRYVGPSTYRSANNTLNRIHQLIDTIRFILFMLFNIKTTDKVLFYSYNSSLMKIVQFIGRIKRIETYYELNEHPTIQIKGFVMDDDSQSDRKKLYDKLKGFSHILCISNSLKELLLRCGFSDKRLHIINMVVNEERFRHLVKQKSDKYIAYCGAADNNKDGVDKLIKAFATIASKHPDVKLYIMGPKRDDCNNEELAQKLGVGNRVVFTGMVSSDELPQRLMDAIILALARPDGRQAKYGFPTKLGEYLMTGNPVVVTGVGDIPLFLKDGESAYIAHPDDCNDFADKLDKALSDIQSSAVVGLAGKSVAINKFTEANVKRQIQNAMQL